MRSVTRPSGSIRGRSRVHQKSAQRAVGGPASNVHHGSTNVADFNSTVTPHREKMVVPSQRAKSNCDNTSFLYSMDIGNHTLESLKHFGRVRIWDSSQKVPLFFWGGEGRGGGHSSSVLIVELFRSLRDKFSIILQFPYNLMLDSLDEVWFSPSVL